MKTNYEIQATSDSVDLWLDTRLPFEPRGEFIDARNALRAALRTMRVRPGAILSATYCSQNNTFCDVENILFYNVGAAAFSDISRHGLRFERRFECPLASPTGRTYSHHHRYGFVTSAYATLSDRPATYTFSCPLPRLSSSSKPHEIWWHAAAGSRSSGASIDGTFELRLVLSCPVQSSYVASFLKPLLDGLIAALHYESHLDVEAVRRLAARTGWDAVEISRRLIDPVAPVLGPRRLLSAYRDFIKWNPADDLCTRCTIIVRNALEWRCAVEVMDLSLRSG